MTSAPVLSIRELNDNGAWSWFMDERCLVVGENLIVGSVRSSHLGLAASRSLPGAGNIELAVWDLGSDRCETVVLHGGLEQDDHNAPGLLLLADGRLLVAYSKHSQERRSYSRVSEPGDFLSWSPTTSLETPGVDHPPYGGDNVTYSNLFQLNGGRILNFCRAIDHQWNWIYSDDDGRTFEYGGMFLRGLDGYSPYFKFAAFGDIIHFIATEDHPRNYDNSVYHGFLREGIIYQSDGRAYAPLSCSATPSGDIMDLTPVFHGDPDNVAWVTDLHLDSLGHPACLFTVQKDGRGLPPTEGGTDHRFHYARWDGAQWIQREIAQAGSRLYSWEDDYTGLAALDPQRPEQVYISTNAHPVSGTPLISRGDGLRHHELFHGVTADGGGTWIWTPLTQDSNEDNLRPLVPIWRDAHVALVWMRGTYEHNTGPWNTRVVASVFQAPNHQ